MILNIGKHESIGGILHGVYYFNLWDYPNIDKIELKNIVAFINYEKSYNRHTEIVCDDEKVVAIVENAVKNPETVENILFADTTDFVYHGTGLYGAQKILSGGKLLSATNVYKKTGEELAYEKRDSLWNDPADFFEYIMFCNGDDMTGDYVVLSENFPSEENLEKGNFNAGVRFYFKSDDIIRHPYHVFDGYHPVKVKNEILLSDYLFLCIVPEQYKVELENLVLSELVPKVHYLSQKGMGLSQWNDKVVDFVKNYSV